MIVRNQSTYTTSIVASCGLSGHSHNIIIVITRNSCNFCVGCITSHGRVESCEYLQWQLPFQYHLWRSAENWQPYHQYLSCSWRQLAELFRYIYHGNLGTFDAFSLIYYQFSLHRKASSPSEGLRCSCFIVTPSLVVKDMHVEFFCSTGHHLQFGRECC